MGEATDRRQAELRRALDANDLDALLVTSLPNVRYLTGFTGSTALLLVARVRSLVVTDFRYGGQARAEIGAAADVRVERSDLWAGLRAILTDLGVARLGVERSHLTLSGARRLEPLERLQVVPTTDLVEGLRLAKDPAEVRAIRDAAALAGEALASVLGFVRPGRTELEIAAELEAALRRRGSEWYPFPSIVASGPRAALPHARCTTRTVGRGEWLVVDFGAQVGGYCSDITRTFVVGAPADGRQREVYEVVRRAQARARAGLRAGLTGKAGDALARDLIAAEGMADAFGHSLGHGLGLEVHEAPRLSQTNEAVLPAGAVVTVEPGVYFDGWGGVRIEDDVVLRPDGAECLSDGRTDLVELT
jgi:Xaa-Pro aminopeptidase